MADPDYHAAKRQGYEWGVKEERERIITLLENTLADFYNTKDDWYDGYTCALSTAIEEIKGENE